MPFNEEEYKGLSSEELIAKLKEVSDKHEQLLAEKPVATTTEKVVTDPKLSEDVKNLGEKNKTLEVSLGEANKRLENQAQTIKTLTEKNYKAEVDAILSEYEDKGVPPAVITKVREVMMADQGSITLKLSETVDGKVQDSTKSLVECIKAILDTIPTIALGETIAGGADGTSDANTVVDDQKNIAKVKEFAEKNKLSFREATKQLMEKGEIPAFRSNVPAEE